MGQQGCSIEECDLFDFMARYVGMTVLHPGGLWATDKLAEMCQIGGDSRVLDIACGKGTSAVHVAEKYGCRMAGLDIDQSFIDQATQLARKKGVHDRVEFRKGDALALPYADGEFDVTFSQAFLILIPDKQQAIGEAVRVTRPGGHIGWLELCFVKRPPQSLFHDAAEAACSFCIEKVLTFDEWEALFEQNGMSDLEIVEGEMGMRSRSMFRDEGLLNVVRIMGKRLFNSRIKRRMDAVYGFFERNKEYIKYGIFVGKKALPGNSRR